MSPWIATWLAVDAVVVLALVILRREATRLHLPVAMQALALLIVVASLWAPLAGGSFWIFVALINSSFVLVSAALGGAKFLRAAGALATLAAAGLVLMGSMASLVIAAMATVLCAGAALVAALPSARAGSRPSYRSSRAAVD
jgi:hypothetical protein